jgi:hypothetical protein
MENTQNDYNLSQRLIEESYKNLDKIIDLQKGHRGWSKKCIDNWYAVRENALNMCLNDHLAGSNLDASDYYLQLDRSGETHFVIVNSVVRFQVEAEDLIVDNIRKTTARISAKCIGQGGLVCSLK